MRNIKQMVDENKQLILNKTQELIRIPSEYDEATITSDAPFGKGIKDCLDKMVSFCKEEGFEVETDSGYCAHASYGNPSGKLIGILCHLDVVPALDGWITPPYDATIIDNKLYGRGSGDDKGPTMAAFFALKFIKDAGIKLKNNVRLIFGTDEETGWRGITHYFEHFPKPSIGFAPDAAFPLIYGEKGRMSYDLSLTTWDKEDILVSIEGGERYNVVLESAKAIVKKDIRDEFIAYAKSHQLEYATEKEGNIYILSLKGLPAHAMEPFKGINAGTHLCNFLKDYSNNKMVKFIAEKIHEDYFLKNLGLDYDDYEMGPITLNVGIMNIEENNTRVTFDLRYPERYDLAKFDIVLPSIIEEYECKISAKTRKFPHYVSPKDPLVEKLYQAYVNNTKDEVNKPFTIGGGTYAQVLERAVAFGMLMPGEEELAHQRNEFIYIDNLLTTIKIYIDAILSLGEIDA